MGQDPPGWYYVGNGQLRYKFGDFWTDQYKTIDHSERSVSTESLESSHPVPTDTSRSVRLRLLTRPRLMTAVCACLLGLGVGGGLLKPDIRHEWVSWATAQASQLSALISRPASPTPATTRDATVKADARAKADAKANANANAKARADAKTKPTPPHVVAPHARVAKPTTKVAEPPAAPTHAATKPPGTSPSSPPKSILRSVTNPR